jgi:hypothetical protein
MAYLLDFQPEMLMAGSRQHLFTEAMANMECIIRKATKGLRPKLREKQPLDNVILGKIKEELEAASLKEKEAYTVIDDACKLAEDLLGIEDHETRWELMHRVWVGMLCYSASMCRSDLHAKSLGEGGGFLSNVWLLISLIGGRTLADKLQMPDDDPEPEGKVVEGPAKDKGEQKPKPEAAGSSGPTLISDIGIGHVCRNYFTCVLASYLQTRFFRRRTQNQKTSGVLRLPMFLGAPISISSE